MNFNKYVYSPPPYQHGFTLLEMVLVLFLIGLMASATLFLTENVEDQAKYEETKRRMEVIREAIVGDPRRTLNGQTEVSGFSSDLGRLPNCLRELLEPNDCSGSPLLLWTINANTGIASGWRGPYIKVNPERSGELRFRDGYLNSDASDATNSGWAFITDASNGRISLTSMGYKIDDINDDVKNMSLVESSDWKLQLPSNVNIEIYNQSTSDLPTSNQNLVLLIYLDNLANPIGTSDITSLSSSEAIASINTTKTFTISPPDNISTGARGYVVACDEWNHDSDGVTPDIYTSFTGSGLVPCSNSEISKSDIRNFTHAPRQNITLDWVIQ